MEEKMDLKKFPYLGGGSRNVGMVTSGGARLVLFSYFESKGRPQIIACYGHVMLLLIC